MSHASDVRVPILIVDDIAANLLALEAVLAPGAQYEIVQASSGEDALRAVEERDFAVVLLDVQMPVMDGLETATRMRKLTRWEHPVPIVFVTGIDGSPARVLRAYTEGAVDFIAKPLQPEMIRAKVAVFAELYRARRRLVSENATATGSLRHTRAWLATTLRSIGDGVIATDVEGHVRFMNEAAERITGWAENEARDRPLSDVFPIFSDATRRPYESPATSVISTGMLASLAEDTVLRARSGRSIPIADSAAPIRDDRNVLIGVVIVFRDATAERRDRARRDFLARAGAALASPIDYRATLGAVSQLAVPQLADRCTIDLFDPGHAPELSTILTSSTMTVPLRAHDHTLGAITFAYDDATRSYERADHEFAEEFARRAAMAVENALMLEQANTARGLAERQQEKADIANRAKDEFLATVSHELRTPLSAMLGWAVTLRARSVPEDIDRGLAIIERNARRQARLIDDLLDVSRIISGKMTLSLTPTRIDEVIKRAMESVGPAAEAKQIDIHADAETQVMVLGDPDRLQQVVWNLLVNAIKFTPERGRVAVQCYRHGRHAVVRVVDNGEGIASHLLPHVFEPFRQGDPSITRRHTGLGLGLAIVQQLVSAHDGRIEASSEGIGRGATFVLRLPALADATVDDTPPVERLDSLGRLDGLSVLVVEDEDDTRALIEYVLYARGARVTAAHSVAAALSALPNAAPDIIVSDIGLPGVDGYSFIRRVREAGTVTPALALTAYARREDVERAKAAGYQMHIAKPIEPTRLVAAVGWLAHGADVKETTSEPLTHPDRLA
jgi:PAS domain S-box-containing protein